MSTAISLSLRIVADELWAAAHAAIAARGLGPRKDKRQPPIAYPLSGLLACGGCRSRLVGYGPYDYACPTHTGGGCANDLRFRRSAANDALFALLEDHLLDRNRIARTRAAIEATLRERERQEDAAAAADGPDIQRLDSEADALRHSGMRPTAIAAGLAEIERERAALVERARQYGGAGPRRAARLIARLDEIFEAYRAQVARGFKALADPR